MVVFAPIFWILEEGSGVQIKADVCVYIFLKFLQNKHQKESSINTIKIGIYLINETSYIT